MMKGGCVSGNVAGMMKRAALNRAFFLCAYFLEEAARSWISSATFCSWRSSSFFRSSISNGEVVYDVIDSYKSLLDIVTK